MGIPKLDNTQLIDDGLLENTSVSVEPMKMGALQGHGAGSKINPINGAEMIEDGERDHGEHRRTTETSVEGERIEGERAPDEAT